MLQVTIPYPVLQIIRVLTQSGFEAYIVGGAVRDVLLENKAVLDWDITTNATPDKLLELLPESFYDNAYGTVMVAAKHITQHFNQTFEFPELDVFDITTYRHETGYSNKRHPDKVQWGTSLQEDVSRRDFTINALAFEVLHIDQALKSVDELGWAQAEVELHDYYNGIQDLNQGLIKTVGKPDQRFAEDALRMLRAVRISAQIGFAIEPQTFASLKKNAFAIAEISKERVRDELFKILASDRPTEGMELLDEAELLAYILPELIQTKGVVQGGRHKYDVWQHSLESLRSCPSKDPLVRLATLLHDIGKPETIQYQGPRGVTFYGHEVVGAHMCNRIADRLRLSKKQKNLLFKLVRWHMFTYSPEMTDSAIRRFIRRIGVENINHMINLRIGDRKGGGSKATSWRLRELQQRIGENLYEPMSVRDLKISGTDLMELLKIKPGPMIGQILETLFEMVMEDRVNNTYEELATQAQILYQQFSSKP